MAERNNLKLNTWHKQICKKHNAMSITIYKNTRAMICSPNGDTDFFDIVTGVLQEDTLASLLSINCLDYILQTAIDLMKKNGFTFLKKRQEADNIPQKLLLMYTMHFKHFIQIHLLNQISTRQPGIGNKNH